MLSDSLDLDYPALVSKNPREPVGIERQFGATLRKVRREREISQASMAGQMAERGWPWHQSTIYRVESGRQALRIGEVLSLAELLGVDLNTLAGKADLLPRPCRTCAGHAPKGFTCNECGRSGS